MKKIFSSVVTGACLMVLGLSRAFGADAAPVSLNWLDKTPPPTAIGVSWGVSWPKGNVTKTQTFALKDATGKALPLQEWPLAYWPDGSIKWTGFATVGDPTSTTQLQVMPAPAAAPGDKVVKVTQGDMITIDTGPGGVICRIPKTGPYIIDSMSVDGREVARHGELECIVQNGPQTDLLTVPTRDGYVSELKTVTVEQSGPVRAVVKLEGVHKAAKGPREWLPFTVRLYFYAGATPVRLVTTTIYDGDQDKDFIKGLGLSFEVPMREQSQNRHVRFTNSNGGVWAEPTQMGAGGGGRGGGGRGGSQLDGARQPNTNNPPPTPSGTLSDSPN